MVSKSRSQIAKGARAKGARAQREIAKVLGLWFFNDTDVFHSTPGSGSLRWKSKIAGTRGDIVAPDEVDWKYSIEIKNQEKSKWDFYSILLGQGPIIKEWWKQCVSDSIVTDKAPWLIFTRNNLPYFSIIEKVAIGYGDYLKEYPEEYFQIHTNDDLEVLILSTLSSLLIANNPKVYNPKDHNEKLNKLVNKIILNPAKRSK